MNTTKQDAIEKILLLMQEHAITLNEIKTRLEPVEKKNSSSLIKKFFGFVGVTFIFCGLVIYMSEHWAMMNSAARIIITLGVGVALFFFAIIASRDTRYEKMLTPLFILAALFETGGMFVAIKELFSSSGDLRYAALLVFGTLFTQQIIAFAKIQRTSLLFTSLFFAWAATTILLDLLGMKSDYISLSIGFSLTCIAYGLTKTSHHSLSPIGYLIGSTLFLWGMFLVLQHTSFELVFLGISILTVYISTLLSSRMLLLTGTASMISYISYFTNKHFVDSVGWPIALILCGMMILVIGAVAMNLGKGMSK